MGRKRIALLKNGGEEGNFRQLCNYEKGEKYALERTLFDESYVLNKNYLPG